MKFATTTISLGALIGGCQAAFLREEHEQRRRLVKLGAPVPNEWIVTVETSSSCEATEQRIKAVLQHAQKSTSPKTATAKVGQERRKQCFVSFHGSEDDKGQVEKSVPEIKSIEQMLRVTTHQAPANWGLDRIDQPKLPLSETPFHGSPTGEGVTVYVIDTGLYKDHVEFGTRSSYGPDFSSGNFEDPVDNSSDDRHGHGTHCAGICCGKTYGVAPGAKVVGVKVIDDHGDSSTWIVIKGLEWASSQPGPSVISMSIGTERSLALDVAAREAANSSIVVVAAGNSNKDACSVSPAGAGGKVITVGSIDINDEMSYFSNYGPCVDMFAPGSNITSAWIGSPNASFSDSGTSMAAPHVSGVAAVLLEKHEGNITSARAELFQLLQEDVIELSFGAGDNGTPNKLVQVPVAKA